MTNDELNEDGSVGEKLGTLYEKNHGLNVEDESEFRSMVTENLPPQPNSHQEIRERTWVKFHQITIDTVKWKLDQTVVRPSK